VHDPKDLELKDPENPYARRLRCFNTIECFVGM